MSEKVIVVRATKATPKKKGGRRKAATRARAQTWPADFINALRDAGVIRDACDAAKVDHSTAYRHRASDLVFAKAWDEALDESTDLLEREAIRRAREHSDTLLIFLLKARRPKVYRETVRQEHSLVPWQMEYSRLIRDGAITLAGLVAEFGKYGTHRILKQLIDDRYLSDADIRERLGVSLESEFFRQPVEVGLDDTTPAAA